MTALLPWLLISLSLFPDHSQSFQTSALSRLHPLNGTWKIKMNGGMICESWSIKNDHEMNGISYKLNNSDTVIFEHMRITEETNRLTFFARVRNQNQGQEVGFKLKSDKDNTFVFENLEHDYPQRVVYQIISKDSVHAWIEGKVQGADNREDYYFTR